MGVLLLLSCFLYVLPVWSIFDGICPRKDPPPGAVVVSPGSRLELTCSGHVKVNGVKVTLTRNVSSENKKGSSSARTPTTEQAGRNRAFTQRSDKSSTVSGRLAIPTTATGISTLLGENRSGGYSDVEHATSPQVVQPTPPSKTTAGGTSDWEDEEMKLEAEYKDKESEGGGRATREVKMRPQWKWNKQLMERADRDWGGLAFLSDGSGLSLSSVRLTDAGKYTCHHGGEETLAVKVIVADPPETPAIFCYKKSPRSKIRCESRPQKPVIKQPNCYLFLSKTYNHGKIEHFQRKRCSYSPQHSRCWCALEHNEDERRKNHQAFLCVTNILGSATSPLINFTPLDILTPDPPSNVMAHLVEGRERMIKVTWNLPITWHENDNFYDIIFEIRYRPSTSSNEQENTVKEHWYLITDALPGVEYLIQLRTKDEYDGNWSEWSSPVSARTWTERSDLTTTMIDLPFTEDYGSGFPDDSYPDGTTNELCANSVLCNVHYNVIWISAVFAIMCVLLAVYIFRHKDRFMSKLYSPSRTTHSEDLSPPRPSIPSSSEEEALVSDSGPQLYKQSDTQVDGENEKGQTEMDRLEATNFNNKSYFFLQM
ncbi:interleukin-6 receptor subunit alpha isoform X2 [Poecilia latipinna]|uniref:interleukin-6 receptor subunit alpha isoform X2 n=1 Tax=Poecilia latipinna TaxID=48699 RepID=UPI00072DC699|nr:PREDICTED: interleukin-6 receptor subunit alpha-like isoform X2 [Poecilia latipinna]